MRPTLRVDPDLCHTCGKCRARAVCKTRAIVQIEAGDLPVIEPSRCRACQVCVAACPFQAIGPATAQSRA